MLAEHELQGELSITIKNSLVELEKVNHFLSRIVEQQNWSKRMLYHLQLACEEWLTNMIRHGFPDGQEHCMEIQLAADTERVTMRLIDEGVPFNPLQQAAPDTRLSLEERPIGGLGLHLVRRTMDEIDYRRTAHQNILVLKKRINREG